MSTGMSSAEWDELPYEDVALIMGHVLNKPLIDQRNIANGIALAFSKSKKRGSDNNGET